jgi:hypothetical protein
MPSHPQSLLLRTKFRRIGSALIVMDSRLQVNDLVKT